MNQPRPEVNNRDRSAWDLLRRSTPARIGLDRAGHAMTTSGALDLGEAHARARDAVHVPLDVDALAGDLADLHPLIVTSQAPDRSTYLRRPDLGRLLASRTGQPPPSSDVVFVLADGLSATAVGKHAAAVLRGCLQLLAQEPVWAVAPPVIATQARVALGDDVATMFSATAVVVLIGERPGLSANDSLGAYLTWQPYRDVTDAHRNCISNIRPPDGLGYDDAARQIIDLLNGARALGTSGVALKNNTGWPAALTTPTEPQGGQ
jgi:ethanolamine ammonia-lyase small subunit